MITTLEGPPFEPLETADMKWVSGKVVTLLLLTTAAQVSKVTALTTRVDFSVNDEQVFIYPDPKFEPKTMDDVYGRAPMVIKGFYPMPKTREQKRLNLSCPVRALHIYLDRTRDVRVSNSSWYCIVNRVLAVQSPERGFRAGW